jgi:hypothetical protein
MASKKKGRTSVQVTTADQALAILGDDLRIAKWLRIDRSEVQRMRLAGIVDRGFFAHFFITLTASGYEPRPSLFGLKTWKTITMPGLKPARTARRVA